MGSMYKCPINKMIVTVHITLIITNMGFYYKFIN